MFNFKNLISFAVFFSALSGSSLVSAYPFDDEELLQNSCSYDPRFEDLVEFDFNDLDVVRPNDRVTATWITFDNLDNGKWKCSPMIRPKSDKNKRV